MKKSLHITKLVIANIKFHCKRERCKPLTKYRRKISVALINPFLLLFLKVQTYEASRFGKTFFSLLSESLVTGRILEAKRDVYVNEHKKN